MVHLLEGWIEEKLLDRKICNRYWEPKTNHANFKAIIDAIDLGGGQTVDIPGVLRELDKAGFVIRKIKNDK